MKSFCAIFFLAMGPLFLLDHGKLVSAFSYSTKGLSSSTVRRPLISRLSSTKSSDVPTVEERVNKAVVPTINDLIKFGLPTLGIWLLQPILSLIDTSVIGMSSSSASSVLELAALGPGIAWIDSSAYLCQFMGMATTNLYAIAISEGDVQKQRKVLSHATIISTVLGLLLFVVQFAFAKPLVTVLAGSAVESIPHALAYARIRSLASVIAVPTIVGQAAFLAAQDSVTPLKAVLVGSIINIVGDVLLVCVLGKGIIGAAWATTFSQIGSALYLLAASWRNTKNSNLAAKNPITTKIMEGSGDTSAGLNSVDVKKKESLESAGASSKEASLWSLVQFPGVKDVTQYISFCGPLFFVLLMKAFSWSYTTYACSPAGPVSLAAHQIVLNMFCIFAIFGDAVSQISQTYLPQFFGSKKTTKKMYNSGKSIISNIMKISISLGLFNCIFAYLAVNKYGQKVSTKTLSDNVILLREPSNILIFKHASDLANFRSSPLIDDHPLSQLFTKSVEVNAGMAGVVLYLAAAIFPNTIMAGKLDRVIESGRVEITDLEG